jgi:hypothetical protein
MTSSAFDVKHTRFLESRNPIPEVGKIKFEHDGHTYWAFSKYYTDWVSSKEGLGGLPLKSATGILDKYFHFDMDGMALGIWNKVENRYKMEYDPTYKYYGCKCVQDIVGKWSQGATDGTKMHAHYEDMANLLEYDKDVGGVGSNLMQNLYAEAQLGGYHEKAYFYDFVRKFKIDDPLSGMTFHRTELLLWHDVLHLSGTIDALLYNKNTDSYIIVDWKRCKGGVKLETNGRKPVYELAAGSRGRGLKAFLNLRNNKINRYGCQLTFYKKLFEHMTGKRVSALYIVSVDSEKVGSSSAFKLIDIPVDKYDECIRQAFEERAREMISTCENTLDDDHMNELIKILDEGDSIRAIENESNKNKDDDEDEDEEPFPTKKQKI